MNNIIVEEPKDIMSMSILELMDRLKEIVVSLTDPIITDIKD